MGSDCASRFDTRFDVVVIGGGPGGTTTATHLARAGLRVALFDKKRFPRFHIGESLLPASLPLLEELGVLAEVERRFLRKPGGKWYYGEQPMFSDFAQGRGDTSFARTPHAYMVKRDEFDELLLRNAAAAGVEVHEGCGVVDVLREGEKVVGVVVSEAGKTRTVGCDMLFDASGFGAVLAKKLGLRRENRLKRMAVFGHYATTAIDEDLKKGWFVGQMIQDGWLWLIPLRRDLVSIGVVVPVERYKNAAASPREFLEHHIRNVPIAKRAITPPELQGSVHLYGNLGHTTSRAHGPGWALVGDAAFFIDPCYSSGVHLALSSGKEAAHAYLAHRRGQAYAKTFAAYEKRLRRDEKLVLRFVDAFYMASRNRFLRWFIPFSNNDRLNRDFVTVTGGDFARRPGLINLLYFTSKILGALFPFRTRDEIGSPPRLPPPDPPRLLPVADTRAEPREELR